MSNWQGYQLKINLIEGERKKLVRLKKDTHPVIVEDLLCVWDLINETVTCPQELQSLLGVGDT